VFAADFDDEELGAIDVKPDAEGTIDCMINKVAKGFREVGRRFSHYDWYFKGDTDTFLFVENLREYLLTEFSGNGFTQEQPTPRYLGLRYHKQGHQDHQFNAGAWDSAGPGSS
jgi:hypothetical protein